MGEAADGEEAVRKARELSPHVVLLDISMPGMSGLAVTKILRHETPEIKVLVLSVHSQQEQIIRVMEAGAHGFVSKDAPPKELLRAIRWVRLGEFYFGKELVGMALGGLVTRGRKGEPFAQLTTREQEVLVRIAEGLSNKEIAILLGLGVRTIETHRYHIMSRLNIHTVAGLTKYAIACGLITLGGDPAAPFEPGSL